MAALSTNDAPRFYLNISLVNPSFRLPELYSAAKLNGFGLRLFHPWSTSSNANAQYTEETRVQAENFIDQGRSAFVLLEFTEEKSDRVIFDLERCLRYCKLLAERCILVKSIHQLFCSAPTLDSLHASLQQTKIAKTHLWEVDNETKDSFAFDIQRVGKRRSGSGMRALVESFSYMNMTRPTRLVDPAVLYTFYEEFTLPTEEELAEMPAAERHRPGNNGVLRQLFFGRFVCEGEARMLIPKFDVKGRAYYGTTSMESEMSLLMSGQTLPAKGKVIYDPFAGTGSCLYTCAHWGAHVVGSDIDGRQMRGKDGSAPGVFRAAEQYGLRESILDILTFDVTRNGWRCGGLFDSIITDPPYGVRAGAKRLGRKETGGKVQKEEPVLMPDGRYAHEMPGYMPVSKPYEMTFLVLDLVLFARYMLVPGGRLVFFLPTVTEDWDEVDVPVVEGMRELRWGGGSCQDFGKWGRRLITMEREEDGVDYPRPTFEEDLSLLPGHEGEGEKKVPGHHKFGDRYATSFA